MANRAKKQLLERFRIINDAEETFLRGIRKTQTAIFEEVIRNLLFFDTEGGRLKYNAEAARKINDLANNIIRQIKKTNYPTKVQSYLKDFEKVTTQNIKLHSSLNKINVRRAGLTNLQRNAVGLTTNQLLGAGLDANLVEPVKAIIFDSVATGQTIPQAEQLLKEFIKGNQDRLGQLHRYATQISRDAISGYDGLIQARIRDEFDLDAISYEGSIIQTSRDQCIRWVGKGVLKNSELQEEINWAFNNGQGMRPGTTPKNFPVFRGGFSCRHFATPIRLV